MKLQCVQNVLARVIMHFPNISIIDPVSDAVSFSKYAASPFNHFHEDNRHSYIRCSLQRESNSTFGHIILNLFSLPE